MSIATKVEGVGYRICETGSPVCTGINPCFGCWVRNIHGTMASCVRRLEPDESKVRQRLPQILFEWQSACLRLSDSLSKNHPEAFQAMQEAVVDAGPERRQDPEVRSQAYWVVLMTQELLAVARAKQPPQPPTPGPVPGGVARAVAPPVDVAPTAAPAVAQPPQQPVGGKPLRGEVAQYMRENSERATAPAGQVLGRVAKYPREAPAAKIDHDLVGAANGPAASPATGRVRGEDADDDGDPVERNHDA